MGCSIMMHDKLERRCPRLGSVVSFGYCRTCGNEKHPCFKVFDCWWEQFDVTAYFKERLSAEAFEQLVQAKPPNKVSSLLDLIQQAQERMKK